VYWILATFLLCLSCSSRRIAREVGGQSRTSYRWCWWLRHTAVSYETDRHWEGTVEADDLYHTAGSKGQAPGGGKKALGRHARGRRKKREPGRGHYDKDRPAIIAWVSGQGAVVIQTTRDGTVKTVQKAADLAVQAGSRLSTDSASSYRALKGYLHAFVNHTPKEYALLERFKYRTVEAERRTIRLGFLLGRGRGTEAIRPSIEGYGLFPRGGGRESQSPGPCTSARCALPR